MAMSMTRLMPKRFRKKGISRIQSVSDTCDSEMSALAWLAPNVAAYSGISRNEVMNGLAKPLVIWSDTPSNMEKMKKMAIFFWRNSVNARSPRASTRLLRLPVRFTGHSGSVKA